MRLLLHITFRGQNRLKTHFIVEFSWITLSFSIQLKLIIALKFLVDDKPVYLSID